MMKKIIWMVFLSIVALWLFCDSSFANSTPSQQGIAKWSMETLFTRLGLDLNRNFNLMMEVHGLVEYRKTRLWWTKLYRILKKYDFKDKTAWRWLPHIDCRPWVYWKLDHDFYSQIASVIPFHNSIKTYTLDTFPGKVFTVWSADIDNLSDNCQSSTVGKDDKSAGCALRMRHHFNKSEFEIVSCK